MNQPTTSKRNITAREREQQATALRLAGLSYEKIAEAIGITASGAYRSVLRAMDRTVKQTNETAEQVKQQELQRLDELQVAVWPQAKKGDIKAIEVILKIQTRRARLLGLDAPEKIDAKVAGELEITEIVVKREDEPPS